MKNKIKHISIFIVILLLVLVGGFFIFRARITAHFTPVVEQMGDIEIEVKNDTAYLSSRLTVKNKSFIKIKADTIKYKVSLFDKTYIKNKTYIGLVLPGNGTDTLDFSLKIPYVAIMKDIKEQRNKGDSSGYLINVALKYSTVLGNSEIAVSKSAKFKLPQPPELEIVKIKYNKVRLKYILADAEIKITNYNHVALSINNMNYNMMIPKQGNLKGVYKEVINIKANGETIVHLPIEINITNAGKILMDVIRDNDKYDYILTINATVESTNPLKESFHIDLTKNGRMELKK